MAKVDLISHIQLAKTIRILDPHGRIFVSSLQTTAVLKGACIVSMVHDKGVGAFYKHGRA